MSLSIAREFSCLLKIPTKLKNVVPAYLLSLALNSAGHTQAFASEVSGLDKSQFSRLLRRHGPLAKDSLTALSQYAAKAESCDRKPLIDGAPWTVGIIIDATLHGRSSLHVQNSQRFNHGQGFVIGHQWTNIVLTIGEEVIPLPPIPFFSKNECKRRGIVYRTEHERVTEYLKDLNLHPWIGIHDPSEILVLMDSGYDDKVIQNTIVSRGWDFISSLKCNRSAKSIHNPDRRSSTGWTQIRELFRLNRKYAPWETVRIQSASKKRKKRKTFRVRRIEGFIKGITIPVALVCSKKKGKKNENFYFACSNLTISTRSISIGYSIRWRVELFHRDTKRQLGMTDAGVQKFDSLIAHVNWVYCTYLLLKQQVAENNNLSSIQHRQKILTKKWEEQRYRKIIQLSTRFDGGHAVKSHCNEVIAELKRA